MPLRTAIDGDPDFDRFEKRERGRWSERQRSLGKPVMGGRLIKLFGPPDRGRIDVRRIDARVGQGRGDLRGLGEDRLGELRVVVLEQLDIEAVVRVLRATKEAYRNGQAPRFNGAGNDVAKLPIGRSGVPALA